MKKIIPKSIFLLLFIWGMNAQTLKTMSYNIRYDSPSDSLNNWENRKEGLISQLKFYTPDIIGTQEGLLHQLQDLKTNLKGYEFLGKGRDDGKTAGEFSAIFYNTASFKVLQSGTFWLSETPSIPSRGWDAALNRVCTYGLFESKQGKKKILVFNTHFDHIGEEARKQSALLILKKIKELNSESFPVLLLGDLNLEPGHQSIQLLTSKLSDAHLKAGENAYGPTGTFSGFFPSEAKLRRIDYIFYSRDTFELLRYGILSHTFKGCYPSDHLPVYAELKW